jgi:hypothetical protein
MLFASGSKRSLYGTHLTPGFIGDAPDANEWIMGWTSSLLSDRGPASPFDLSANGLLSSDE